MLRMIYSVITQVNPAVYNLQVCTVFTVYIIQAWDSLKLL